MTCAGILFCFAMLRIFAFKLIALLTGAPPNTDAEYLPRASFLRKSLVYLNLSLDLPHTVLAQQEKSPFPVCFGYGSYHRLCAQSHMRERHSRQEFSEQSFQAKITPAWYNRFCIQAWLMLTACNLTGLWSYVQRVSDLKFREETERFHVKKWFAQNGTKNFFTEVADCTMMCDKR